MHFFAKLFTARPGEVKRVGSVIQQHTSPDPSLQPGPQRAGAVVVIVIPAASKFDDLWVSRLGIEEFDHACDIAERICDHPVMIRAGHLPREEGALHRWMRKLRAENELSRERLRRQMLG